jgi:DNA-binding beta-propeller fold protein YncE
LYNLSTGQRIGNDLDLGIADPILYAAFNPVDGGLYCLLTGDNTVNAIAYVDIAAGTASRIGSVDQVIGYYVMNGLAFDPAGMLYTVANIYNYQSDYPTQLWAFDTSSHTFPSTINLSNPPRFPGILFFAPPQLHKLP